MRQSIPAVQLVSAQEAARQLTVSLRTLRSLVASGALTTVRVSARRIAFHPGDIASYIEQRRRA